MIFVIYLQRYFKNSNMKLLSLKYLTVVFIVFCLQLPGCSPLSAGKAGVAEYLRDRTSFNISQEKNKSGLEISPSRPKPAEHAEKVEPTVILGPDSSHKGVRYIYPFSLQIKTLSVMETSLSGHSSLLFSVTVHKSPVINILRI